MTGVFVSNPGINRRLANALVLPGLHTLENVGTVARYPGGEVGGGCA